MNVENIEYHLEFFSEDGERVEHYGNMGHAFIAPRKGERITFVSKKRTFEITDVIHEFIEHQTPFHIGHVIRLHGKEVAFDFREF